VSPRLARVTAPRLRKDIDDLPAYKAGQRPSPRTDLVTYKISSNENPYPPLPGVMDAIMRAAADIHRYPDPFSVRLVDAIASHFDVPADQIVLGTGSVAICGQVITAAAAPGDEVIYAWRSFESYPIWTQIAGATSIKVPLLPDERHDLEAMIAAVTDRTRVIFICNPNNPTGQVVTTLEIEDFLARVPSDVIVVMDEAYREFITGDDVPNGIDLCRQHPNIVVLRTFSKAYGLAALRVGFGVAHPTVAQALRKMAIPFGVSTIAEEAAIASLAAEDELFERVRALVRERERVWTALRDQGWAIHRTEANFIWLRLGEHTMDFVAACEQAGITIRPFPGEGVRITVAETQANERVIAVAGDFRQRMG
jgi:histidinol-phosphate aminotransferase